MSKLHHSQRWAKLSLKIKRKANGFCANPFGLHTNHNALGGQVLTYCSCVHHIKPIDDYPDQVYDEDNCIALCKRCHDFAHKLYNADKRRYFDILLDNGERNDRGSSNLKRKQDVTEEELLKNMHEVFTGEGFSIKNGRIGG